MGSLCLDDTKQVVQLFDISEYELKPYEKLTINHFSDPNPKGIAFVVDYSKQQLENDINKSWINLRYERNDENERHTGIFDLSGDGNLNVIDYKNFDKFELKLNFDFVLDTYSDKNQIEVYQNDSPINFSKEVYSSNIKMLDFSTGNLERETLVNDEKVEFLDTNYNKLIFTYNIELSPLSYINYTLNPEDLMQGILYFNISGNFTYGNLINGDFDKQIEVLVDDQIGQDYTNYYGYSGYGTPISGNITFNDKLIGKSIEKYSSLFNFYFQNTIGMQRLPNVILHNPHNYKVEVKKLEFK